MKGSTTTDSKSLFRAAYENRYTWDENFKGYKGNFTFEDNHQIVNGLFTIASDLKPKVSGVKDDQIVKSITSQLWEVAIHRVRRTFDEVHGLNTFEFGEINDMGTEIIVGGKNKGDRYRVKDNKINLVYRHIHGSLINIETKTTIDTGHGYLSNMYSSQYLDPKTKNPIKQLTNFEDLFVQLSDSNYWVLSQRVVDMEKSEDLPSTRVLFKFTDLQNL